MLDYIFISHSFQEVVKDLEILYAISTDQSAFFYSFQHFSKLKSGADLWKFNNSLVKWRYHTKVHKTHPKS